MYLQSTYPSLAMEQPNQQQHQLRHQQQQRSAGEEGASHWSSETAATAPRAKRRKIEHCLPDYEEIQTRHGELAEHADVVLDLEQELNSLYSSFDEPSHAPELGLQAHQRQQQPSQDTTGYYYNYNSMSSSSFYSSSPVPIFPAPASSPSSSSCSAASCSSCSSFSSSPATSSPSFTSYDSLSSSLSSSWSLPASRAESPSWHAPPSPTPMPPPAAVMPSQALVRLPSETATVTLTHKPRGSQGTWCPLDNGQRIRVTKGRGKRLRIEIRCRQRFDWPDVRFRLLDVTDTDETSLVPPPACADFSVCNDRSTLQDEEDGGSTAVIEFHVSRVRVRLQCEVTLEHQTPPDTGSGGGGWTWQGRTATFVTHNNGKDRPPSRRKRAARANASSSSSS